MTKTLALLLRSQKCQMMKLSGYFWSLSAWSQPSKVGIFLLSRAQTSCFVFLGVFLLEDQCYVIASLSSPPLYNCSNNVGESVSHSKWVVPDQKQGETPCGVTSYVAQQPSRLPAAPAELRLHHDSQKAGQSDAEVRRRDESL